MNNKNGTTNFLAKHVPHRMFQRQINGHFACYKQSR